MLETVRKPRSIWKALLSALLVSGVVLVVLLIYVWPSYPQTLLHWVGLLTIGPVLLLLGELLGSFLMSKRASRSISRKQGPSFLRMLYVFAVFVALLGLGGLGVLVLGSR
jgi:hypothetical protein